MAKSYRTAVIRVTAENNTNQDGMVIYKKSDVYDILKDWAFSAGFTYWFIEHGADDEVTTPHYHIVIKFRTPTLFETIKNKFPYGMIESARNLRAAVQYLIHLNDKSKVQYSWDDIETNCQDMAPYKILSSAQQEITLQAVYESIERGEICGYNVMEKVPMALFANNRTKIENALLHRRERVLMDKNRDILVMFISGGTGTGKTSFAKDYCLGLKKRPCISSSSNDPLQDYKGEPVLILDDMRDDSFKFHDFLKLLDNHTLSSSKSRYHNKAFVGDTIIITSTKPLADWYYTVKAEDKKQLYRRIRCHYQFTFEEIKCFEYNDMLRHYIPAGSAPNPYPMKAKDIARLAMKAFDAVGIDFSPADKKTIDEAIKNITDEEFEKLKRESPIPEATEEEKEARKKIEEGESRRRYAGKR